MSPPKYNTSPETVRCLLLLVQAGARLPLPSIDPALGDRRHAARQTRLLNQATRLSEDHASGGGNRTVRGALHITRP